MSIDPTFIELTADVFRIFVSKYSLDDVSGPVWTISFFVYVYKKNERPRRE